MVQKLINGQIKDFLGLDMGAVPSEFIEKLGAYAANITTINPVTVAIGAVALVILILWPKVTDKLPGSLIAIIVTTAIVYFAKLPVNTIGSVYGELSSEFPSFHMPAFSYKLVQELISPAFTIAILAGIESLLSAVVSDGMIGDTHKSNAELIGQGLGNIFSGLFGGIPATGAIARTAANIKNGEKDNIIYMGHAAIHTDEAKVYVNDKSIELTALEYRLLLIFASNKGILLTRQQILDKIWDTDGNFVEDNTLTVYVKRLREKLGEAIHIETVRGMGYRVD